MLAQSQQPAVMEFHQHSEAERNRFFDRPQINPSPGKALVLQGSKDAHIEVWLHLSYGTNNEKCNTQTLFASILGAPDVPQTVTDSVRIPAGKTAFSASFFLDRYLPGRCNWQPFSVSHAEFEPSVGPGPYVMSGVVAIRSEGKRKTKVTWVCHRKPSYLSEDEPKRLECIAGERYSDEDTTVSIDGAVVEVDFTLAPDPESP
ncbi:hypothetical protein PWP93_29265 [Paraburkholderia sp. A1RI-2L]|uniref:hypothetical protein n=1 Tax=Paraburkholderia sp. A1RI-2L TaxID=3028367 RepID=UPI003B7ADAC4